MVCYLFSVDGENTKNWRLYSPNYYFPSIETYSAIPVGLVISFCSSFGKSSDHYFAYMDSRYRVH